MNSVFDKRLDFLLALAVAVKNDSNCIFSDEIDFVEYPNLPYVKKLIDAINIRKYPEMFEYIRQMNDCGYYINLYLYFDENFNFNNCFPYNVFDDLNCDGFAKLVKKIYDQEPIQEVFDGYSKFLLDYGNDLVDLYKFDFEGVKSDFALLFDNVDSLGIDFKVSFLMNGGAASVMPNFVSYVRGIGKNLDANKSIVEYYYVCLYHEVAHFFVNPVVEAFCSEEFLFNDFFQETIENGLPSVYSGNNLSFLFEYFVRAISLVFGRNLISSQEYLNIISSYKTIGFVRIEEIINCLDDGIVKHISFNEIFSSYVSGLLDDNTKVMQ